MRPIDADELIELIDSYIKDSNQVERSDSFVDGMKDGYYRIRSRILNMPTAQPEHLTDDDFETIRIHLSAFKESLCNQRRWKEAEEYERLISRFMSFASAQSKTAQNILDGDLISRKDAIAHLKKRLIETAINNVGVIARCDSIFGDTADNRIGPWLNELPSAQPERKRGKWTPIGMKMYKTVGRTPDQKEVLLEKEWRREEKIQCSCCGKLTMLDYSITYQFCPHCGADMREVDDERPD